jgi:hypothetical protein
MPLNRACHGGAPAATSTSTTNIMPTSLDPTRMRRVPPCGAYRTTRCGAAPASRSVTTEVARGGSADAPPAFVRFLNQRKYPASPLFLLMTLGPLIAMLPFAERARGWLAAALTTFGRVPLFYYLLHIPLIHAVALVVNLLRQGVTHQERYTTAPYVSMPPNERWPLALLYLVWLVAVAILYPLCRWYAQRKAQNPQPWMRYV